jgi:hypothetical protein
VFHQIGTGVLGSLRQISRNAYDTRQVTVGAV